MNKYIYTVIVVIAVVLFSYLHLLRRSNVMLQNELVYKEQQLDDFREAQRSNLDTIDRLTSEKEDIERRWKKVSDDKKVIEEKSGKLRDKVTKPTQAVKAWSDQELPRGITCCLKT